MTTSFADLAYESPAYDLVRFRPDALDDSIVALLATAIADDELDDLRRTLSADDRFTLTLFARRRIVAARRASDPTALGQAFDGYALAGLDENELNCWFKGALYFGRAMDVDLDEVLARFEALADGPSAQLATVAGQALDRIEHLAQCYLVETTTSHGTGLLNTVVVRDALPQSGLWSVSGITGIPTILGAYEVGYDIASRVAAVAAALADAFDALDDHVTSDLRHDQLVASAFDIVTSGSYLPTRACVEFYVDVTEGLSFSVKVAEVDPEVTGYSAEQLAELADELVDQMAVARGSLLALFLVAPDFEDLAYDESDEEFDDDPLAVYLDLVNGVLGASI